MTHPASDPTSPQIRSSSGLAAEDLSVRGMIVVSAASMASISVLDSIDGHAGIVFSLGFALVVVTVVLAVDVRNLFAAGVLPPVLLLASLLALCIVRPESVAVDGVAENASLVTRYIASVVDHGLTLVVGHGLALATIGWRIAREV